MPKPDDTPREQTAFEKAYNGIWDGETDTTSLVKTFYRQPLPFTRSPSTTFRQVISISRHLLQSKLTQKAIVQESLKRCCSAMAKHLLVNYPLLLNNFLEFDFAFLFQDAPVSGLTGGGEMSFIVSISLLSGLPQRIIDVAVDMWRLPPSDIDSAYFVQWPILSGSQPALLHTVGPRGHERFIFDRVLLSNTYILNSIADDAFRFQALHRALFNLFDTWVTAKTVWIGSFPPSGGQPFTKMIGYLTDVAVDVSWGDPKNGPIGNYHAVSLFYANEVPASLYPNTLLALPVCETSVSNLTPGKSIIGSSPLVDPTKQPKVAPAPAIYVPMVKPMTLKNLLDELRKEDDTI